MTNKKQPTVIITGANGFVGGELVTYFKQKDWKVIGLVREPDKLRDKSVRWIAYELGKPFDESFFRGADYLVHTAYVKYDRQHPDAMAVNVEGAKRLLAASRKYGLRKNLFMSSMSAHEDAASVYGRQKLAIEALFGSKNDVALRCGLIIGSGGIVRQMVDFMRAKRVVPLVGGGKQPLQVIAVSDLARCVENCLAGTLSGRFTVATPRVYTYKEFYQAIGEKIGVKPLFVPVPFIVLQTALKIADILHISLSVSEDNLQGLKKLRAMETQKDLAKIGVEIKSLDGALEITTIS